MATLGATVLTMTDWAKRLGPDNKIEKAIIELFNQLNEILMDIPWRMCNDGNSHKLVSRTGLPSVAWKLINQGTTPSKSTTAQALETTGVLDAWSETDIDLLELEEDQNAFLLSEAMPFFESMNQEFVQTLFYGNASLAQEEFTGLSVRYSSTAAVNGTQIVLGGGSGSDNTSVWFITWGESSFFGLVPKGSVAGVRHEDIGKETAETTAGLGGTRLRVYRSHWQWKAGVAVKDWRNGVRIPNLDVSDLAGGSPADLFRLFIRAFHRLHNTNMGRTVIYMNRTVYQFLDIQGRTAVSTGGQLGYSIVEGKEIMNWRGLPIRRCDQLVETEALVA